MHNTALVSVVVPAYNHAGSLPAAIESLLAQDYPALEIIVLDDGSTDNTREVLARFSSVIRWESHSNMGQAATLNKGWSMAKGEILGYLSADDLLYPRAVSASVSALSGSGFIVSYCDFDHIDPLGQRLRTIKRPEFNLEKMLLTLDCPPGPGAFFKRHAYTALGGWNPRLRQIPDFDFWLRMSLIGNFVHIPEVLAAWRVHPGSQSFAISSPERSEESIAVIQEFFSTAHVDLNTLRSRSLARAHLYCAQLHGRAGRYRCAISRLMESLELHPSIILCQFTWRSIFNALLSRPLHYFIWRLRELASAKA